MQYREFIDNRSICKKQPRPIFDVNVRQGLFGRNFCRINRCIKRPTLNCSRDADYSREVSVVNRLHQDAGCVAWDVRDERDECGVHVGMSDTRSRASTPGPKLEGLLKERVRVGDLARRPKS